MEKSEYLLNKLEHKIKDGVIIVTAEHTLENVKAKLHLTYRISNCGIVKVTQEMITEQSANMPDLFRFGMQLQMPRELNQIRYYGRGPFENYSDRKHAAWIGKYNQIVDEQFYPYIRPQECGTKSDIRWWKLTDKAGDGLNFTGEHPYLMSALYYSIESLDDGDYKDQRHSELVPPNNYINVCIDKAQMGLGCVNSWGALPLQEYRLPYANYKFSFLLQPITSDVE